MYVLKVILGEMTVLIVDESAVTRV